MRRTIIAALALVGAAACYQDDKRRAEVDAAAARAAIAAAAAMGAEATRMKNIDGYMAQIPEDQGMRDGDGNEITRDQLRAQVLAAWESIRETRALEVQVGSVILGADSATVFLTQRWDRLVVKPGGKGVDTVVSETARRETWRKTPAGWRSYDGVTTHSRVTINGAQVLTVPALQGRSP